jgi:hypothetical protein
LKGSPLISWRKHQKGIEIKRTLNKNQITLRRNSKDFKKSPPILLSLLMRIREILFMKLEQITTVRTPLKKKN